MVMTNENKKELLFDYTESGGNLFDYELNEGLTDEEIDDALFLVEIGLVRGVAIVVGMPGAGKDLFTNTLTYKIKKYFKNRVVLRDEPPKPLYGFYEPFSEETLLADVDKLNKIAKGESKPKLTTAKNMTDAIAKWQTEEGEVKMQNSIIQLSEFWRYFHNRRPMNPMGILMGGVLKTWRHFNCLVIGIAQQKRELDRFSCLPFITHEIRCIWRGGEIPDTTEAHIYPVRSISADGVTETAGESAVLFVDGGKPRKELGGKRYYDLFNSQSAVPLKIKTSFHM